MLAVVDYGMGNLASVAKALERAGADVRLTQSTSAVDAADGVVLPGVGAFRDAAARLESTGLGAVVTRRIAAGAPFLGVCLGLQLLFESSGEGGRWQGLGVLGGTVERLETPLKVPHIGWNELAWRAAGAGMARGLPAPPPSTSCIRTPPAPPTRPWSPRTPTMASRSVPLWLRGTSGRYSFILRRARARDSACCPTSSRS